MGITLHRESLLRLVVELTHKCSQEWWDYGNCQPDQKKLGRVNKNASYPITS